MNGAVHPEEEAGRAGRAHPASGALARVSPLTMGMFHDLMAKIFAHGPGATPALASTPPPNPSPDPASTSAPSPTPGQPAVDIGAVMAGLAAHHPEALDWGHSIVDLLKLVGMDSGLSARKELAAELHYAGDPSDSATMNQWLHREVLRQLAANGGMVPAELLG